MYIVYIYIYLYVYIYIYIYIHSFIIGFIYRPHMRIPQSGRHVRESGTQAPFRVFSCASDRSFVIERQVFSLSTKPQVSTTLHCTITICVQQYSAWPKLLACQCRGPRVKSQICSGDRRIEPRTLSTSSRVCNHQTTKATYIRVVLQNQRCKCYCDMPNKKLTILQFYLDLTILSCSLNS